MYSRLDTIQGHLPMVRLLFNLAFLIPFHKGFQHQRYHVSKEMLWIRCHHFPIRYSVVYWNAWCWSGTGAGDVMNAGRALSTDISNWNEHSWMYSAHTLKVLINMPFSKHFYPKRLAYILRMGHPGNWTHYPGVTSAMLYQMSYKRAPQYCGHRAKIGQTELLFVDGCMHVLTNITLTAIQSTGDTQKTSHTRSAVKKSLLLHISVDASG